MGDMTIYQVVESFHASNKIIEHFKHKLAAEAYLRELNEKHLGDKWVKCWIHEIDVHTNQY